ncbi:MAG TPA: hypothetical protein VED41_07010, partial [Solirubrobacteraceae bacterium]|nr:hypothetical protein [Solirubrobacteraceae bacterium]
VGKYLFNLVLLLALYDVIVPLFCALMGYAVAGVPGLVMVMVGGAVALAATSTIVAAIISRASGSSTLFAIMSVPLVLPLLVFLIRGTRDAAGSGDLQPVLASLRAIVAYAGVTLITSVGLFRVVWND